MTRSDMLEMIGGTITLPPNADFLDYFTFAVRRRVRDGEIILTVLRDCRVETSDGIKTIPTWLESDGASIPKLARAIAGDPFDFDYIREAVLHDFLYRDLSYHPRVSRKIADRIFRETMWNAGAVRYKVAPFYLAVKFGGHSSYKKLNTMTLP